MLSPGNLGGNLFSSLCKKAIAGCSGRAQNRCCTQLELIDMHTIQVTDAQLELLFDALKFRAADMHGSATHMQQPKNIAKVLGIAKSMRDLSADLQHQALHGVQS
jgi:hypothetical protein